MIRIELDEPTLARTRIATSPLWEAKCSLYLLQRYRDEAPWPYTGWSRHAWRVLAEQVPATTTPATCRPGCARSSPTGRPPWTGSPTASRRTGTRPSRRGGRRCGRRWTRRCCTGRGRRAGRRVLYGLEPAGLALVTLLGADPATASA